MSVADIMGYLEPIGLIGLVIVIGSLIKIKPLEINLWNWLARKLGNALNGDLKIQIDEIQKKQAEIEDKLDQHVNEQEKANAMHDRKSILLFANDILQGRKHTKEQFLNVLQIIDNYENYCKQNPDFPNNRCLLAIDLIKNNYKERLEKSDFLAEEYRLKLYKEKSQ